LTQNEQVQQMFELFTCSQSTTYFFNAEMGFGKTITVRFRNFRDKKKNVGIISMSKNDLKLILLNFSTL